MEKTIWLVIMLPYAGLFTGIGIFAWKRKKPMWFWAGSEVKASEISDVPAYNRANGRMGLPENRKIISEAGCIRQRMFRRSIQIGSLYSQYRQPARKGRKDTLCRHARLSLCPEPAAIGVPQNVPA